jgi:hypothetical protein
MSNGLPLFSISPEHAAEFIDRLNFLVGHQDIRIVEYDLHSLDIRDHVMREIAAVESHAFDDLQGRLDGGAELHGDDALIAGALESFGHHVTELIVIRSDAGDGVQLRSAIETPRRADPRYRSPRAST